MSKLNLQVRNGTPVVTTTELRRHQKTILDKVLNDFDYVQVERNGKVEGYVFGPDAVDAGDTETVTYGDDDETEGTA